ncbi:hypothetical protein PI125_g16251 [Phytophthora idaei]|nr:hypothetical protein PI125_g16251 [Phytophthora idaei]
MVEIPSVSALPPRRVAVTALSPLPEAVMEKRSSSQQAVRVEAASKNFS